MCVYFCQYVAPEFFTLTSRFVQLQADFVVKINNLIHFVDSMLRVFMSFHRLNLSSSFTFLFVCGQERNQSRRKNKHKICQQKNRLVEDALLL